jgi:hypothetical protein
MGKMFRSDEIVSAPASSLIFFAAVNATESHLEKMA